MNDLTAEIIAIVGVLLVVVGLWLVYAPLVLIFIGATCLVVVARTNGGGSGA